MEILCFFPDREPDREGRLPAFALGKDRPAVKGDDLFGDGQSQPCAPGAGGAGVIQAVEFFKQGIQLVCVNRFARAGDPDGDSLFSRYGADGHLCSRVAVSRRVFQKVVEDPGQLLPIPPDLERLLGAEGHIVPVLRKQRDMLVDDLHQQICDAREQLEGDKYDRMVFTLKGAVEGAETFAVVDEIRDMVKEYYDESYVVGDATSNEELSNSFQKDNIMISVLTALFVWAILLFTFQNAGLPFLLVLTIQGSIWINFAIPYVINDKMYFLSYLIVSSIQMGATIDYAIVITSRYMVIRKEMTDRKAAIIETLNQAFPTIITSGTMMVCAGFVIGALTSNATIASLGKTLGRGALISIILVMSVLPQLLLVGDKLIDKAELTRSSKRGQEKEEASES